MDSLGTRQIKDIFHKMSGSNSGSIPPRGGRSRRHVAGSIPRGDRSRTDSSEDDASTSQIRDSMRRLREEVREDRLNLAGELRSFHDSLLQNETREMQNAERHMAQQAELANAQRHVAQKAELVQQEYLQMQEQARNMSQLESQERTNAPSTG